MMIHSRGDSHAYSTCLHRSHNLNFQVHVLCSDGEGQRGSSALHPSLSKKCLLVFRAEPINPHSAIAGFAAVSPSLVFAVCTSTNRHWSPSAGSIDELRIQRKRSFGPAFPLSDCRVVEVAFPDPGNHSQAMAQRRRTRLVNRDQWPESRTRFD
jgi:hypothetical protein